MFNGRLKMTFCVLFDPGQWFGHAYVTAYNSIGFDGESGSE